MKENVRGALLGFGAFLIVCVLALFAVIVVFAEVRFNDRVAYKAVFTNVSGLAGDDFVRIAGVEVGRVDSIDLREDNAAVVTFSLDKSVRITSSTGAAVRYANLIGDRFLALTEGAGDPVPLQAGATIPEDRTSPALDLDALLGGFRPLFRALDPEQVNDLTGQLVSVFQGQGGTIASVLDQTAQLTNTLADRDQLIGSVINNLTVVLGTFARRNTEFSTAVDKLQLLVSGLASQGEDIGAAVGDISKASGSVADLLIAARPPLEETIHQTERTAGQIDSDRDYFDNLLATLPETYKILGRQGLYGDFFSFYLCDAALKVNGPDGNPVYIKVVAQETGRCTPQ